MRGRRRQTPGRPLPQLPPCKVCGEVGTGFHYGVTTCGACKGFFRRSLTRVEPYECQRSGNCLIGPETDRRGSCPKCRYKKCLAVGMSKDAIKTGRYSYEKKSKDIMEIKEFHRMLEASESSPRRQNTRSGSEISADMPQENIDCFSQISKHFADHNPNRCDTTSGKNLHAEGRNFTETSQLPRAPSTTFHGPSRGYYHSRYTNRQRTTSAQYHGDEMNYQVFVSAASSSSPDLDSTTFRGTNDCGLDLSSPSSASFYGNSPEKPSSSIVVRAPMHSNCMSCSCAACGRGSQSKGRVEFNQVRDTGQSFGICCTPSVTSSVCLEDKGGSPCATRHNMLLHDKATPDGLGLNLSEEFRTRRTTSLLPRQDFDSQADTNTFNGANFVGANALSGAKNHNPIPSSTPETREEIPEFRRKDLPETIRNQWVPQMTCTYVSKDLKQALKRKLSENKHHVEATAIDKIKRRESVDSPENSTRSFPSDESSESLEFQDTLLKFGCGCLKCCGEHTEDALSGSLQRETSACGSPSSLQSETEELTSDVSQSVWQFSPPDIVCASAKLKNERDRFSRSNATLPSPSLPHVVTSPDLLSSISPVSLYNQTLAKPSTTTATDATKPATTVAVVASTEATTEIKNTANFDTPQCILEPKAASALTATIASATAAVAAEAATAEEAATAANTFPQAADFQTTSDNETSSFESISQAAKSGTGLFFSQDKDFPQIGDDILRSWYRSPSPTFSDWSDNNLSDFESDNLLQTEQNDVTYLDVRQTFTESVCKERDIELPSPYLATMTSEALQRLEDPDTQSEVALLSEALSKCELYCYEMTLLDPIFHKLNISFPKSTFSSVKQNGGKIGIRHPSESFSTASAATPSSESPASSVSIGSPGTQQATRALNPNQTQTTVRRPRNGEDYYKVLPWCEFSEAELDDVISIIMAARETYLGWDFNSISEEEVERRKETYRKLTLVKEKIFGKSTAIFGREQYCHVLHSTGIDLDGRKKWEEVHSLVTEPAIHGIVNFIKAVPGFKDICKEDKVVLCKNAVMGCIVLSSTKGFDPKGNLLLSYTNAGYNEEEMKKLFPEIAGVWQKVMESGMRLNRMSLPRTETELLKALHATRPDRIGLKEPAKVKAVHWRLQCCLLLSLMRRHPQPYEVYTQVNGLLTDLKQVDLKILAFTNSVKDYLEHLLAHVHTNTPL
ncbi:uncharacterized protein LOC101859352, partial [Aplysia californica]|uniref:Uncharacterized protein LOC101859352 n=1 Tax=Aplysia californica TaxID=6500 RepID=A0ABM1A6B0_APLCA